MCLIYNRVYQYHILHSGMHWRPLNVFPSFCYSLIYSLFYSQYLIVDHNQMFSQASVIGYHEDEVVYYGAYVEWQVVNLT